MSNTVAGIQSPIEQPYEIEYDFQNGFTGRRSWRGESRRSYDFTRQVLNSNPDRMRITSDGIEGRITAEYNFPQFGQREVPLITLEIQSFEIQQNIFFNKTFAAIDPARAAWIADQVANPAGFTGPTLAGAEKQAYVLLAQGTTAFVNIAYLLRRTVSAGRYYPFTPDLTNDGKVFTPAQLTANLANVGGALPFALPTQTITAAESAAGWITGWRKNSTEFRIVSDGHRQLVEAWTLFKYESALYDAAS